MVKAIIFDCFGVLVTDALQVICDELRMSDPAAADEIKDLVHLANRGVIDSADYGDRVAELLGTNVEGYRQMVRDGEVKNHVLLSYIKTLKPNYKIGMLSNIGKGSLARRFTEHELTTYFDAVVASGEIGYAKPEAEAYETTAERIGVRLDECVFTDDREEFCEAARAVGMRSILYVDFEQFQRDLAALLPPSS